MESYGLLSIIPALLAIGLSIWTKRVILSLFAGVVVGLLIYTGHVGETVMELVEILVAQMTDDWQARILLFSILVGGLMGIMHSSGGALAFGRAAEKKVNTRSKAQLATWFLGVLVFFDDYFNIMTVGSIMRNVTDRYKISREKLAYIIDSTAAPICIIMPISTWIAYTISLYMAEFDRLGIEVNELEVFFETVPYNFYAIAAIILVVYFSVGNLEFGPMAKAEKRAIETGQVFDITKKDEIPGQDITDMKQSEKGTIIDLIVPILVLIVTVIIVLLYTGSYWEEGVSIFDAIGDADSTTALVTGSLLANIVGIAMYTSRKLLSVKDCMESFIKGLKAMVPALAILILAWSIGDVSGMLGTGDFVAGLVAQNMPVLIIPFTIFMISAGVAFATGSSWGTFAIMMPIGVPVAVAVGLNPAICIAAVLGGGVFGDHSSPISDTTVLSSTGANCNHIDHVNTQLPYALVAAAVAALGYIIATLMNQSVIPLIIVLIILGAMVYLLHKTAIGVEIEEEKVASK